MNSYVKLRKVIFINLKKIYWVSLF